jgi:hypothetical protein
MTTWVKGAAACGVAVAPNTRIGSEWRYSAASGIRFKRPSGLLAVPSFSA